MYNKKLGFVIFSVLVFCLCLFSCTQRRQPLHYSQLQQNYLLVPIVHRYGLPKYHKQESQWYSKNRIIIQDESIEYILPAPIIFTAEEYQLVEKQSILQAYQQFRVEMLQEFGLQKWHKTYRCDKWSQAFLSYLAGRHFQSDAKGHVPSIAAGELWYWPDRAQLIGHAINFFLIAEGGRIYVWYFDPVLGIEVSLSEKEIESIWYLKI